MKLIKSLVLLTGAALLLSAQSKKEVEKLAPYYPTPEVIVEKMLQMTNLKKGEKMFDLGSGDGRIVIIAAEKFAARSTGVAHNEAYPACSASQICRYSTAKSMAAASAT